uniref:Uncharacterized protein n=1 Tax=Populus trichocarpa TaxID=3694 RepID=A0A2K1X278_POPTR
MVPKTPEIAGKDFCKPGQCRWNSGGAWVHAPPPKTPKYLQIKQKNTQGSGCRLLLLDGEGRRCCWCGGCLMVATAGDCSAGLRLLAVASATLELTGALRCFCRRRGTERRQRGCR